MNSDLLIQTIPLLMCLFISTCETYRFGIGIYDITGPIAGVNMMGYADPSQYASGLHLRLFSRTFIIQENQTSRPIVIVSIDTGMVSQLVKIDVIRKLQEKYGSLFDHQNVLISAIHTHSGPGGYFQYFLYSITSLGYIEETFKPLVTGILESISLAYSNMMDGKIFIAEGNLFNASINRSPASYMYNPKDERAKYEFDVDKQMVLLKFVDKTDKPVGMLNWFAVHPVSMNMSNKLISSDNKGLASLLFEQHMNGDQLLGKGPFVAAFAQANEGDVTPNIAGPRCIDTGLPCDFIHSTCNGRVQKCISFGPGTDMFESTRIISQRQMDRAMQLFTEATEELTGPIGFIHQFVDMTNITVTYNATTKRTCKPAMGYSFAAGTIDGPGDFNFIQGSTKGSLFWNLVRDVLRKPSQELIKCHAPKPILLATGEISFPYMWQPNIVETQMLRIGNLLIAAVPGEFTTMSGRRIREAVEKVSSQISRTKPFRAVIAGLSNLYTSYVATPEEYQLQRYEGASTIYGPFTLPAYVDQFANLTASLVQGIQLPPGPSPPFFLNRLISFLPNVWFDMPHWGRKFGDVLVQPLDVYPNKNDTVVVVFVSASPRNDVRLNDTFLTVDRWNTELNRWTIAYTDANWETKFYWSRNGYAAILFGQSEARIVWSVTSISGECQPGSYRIRHFNTAKNLFGKLTSFVGVSNTFQVQCS